MKSPNAGCLVGALICIALSGCNVPRIESSPEPAPTATTFSVATATAAPSGGVTARLNEAFTLKVSQWATLSEANNARVFFTTILEDSRCPVNVNCYQPGKVRVLITVESGGKTARFDLSTSAADYRRQGAFGGYVVALIDVASVPHQIGTPIPLDEYRVTLSVSAGSLNATQAHFNEPFTLKLGQTVDVQGSSMRLTFESVKQDSRCPTRASCATSGTAILAIQLTYDSASESPVLEVGGKGFMTSYPAVRTVSVMVYASALTPYPQQEFASKEISSGEYEATFLIVNPAVPLSTPTPRASTSPVPFAVCTRDFCSPFWKVIY